jgi:YD repeat-containing protein
VEVLPKPVTGANPALVNGSSPDAGTLSTRYAYDEVGNKIRQTAQGRATLVFAAELDEALEVADRIVIMHDHAIVADVRNADVDLNAILAAIAGSRPGRSGRKAA